MLIVRRIAALLLLLICATDASADTVWKGANGHSFTRGSGDVLDAEGSTVTVSAESVGESGFVAATTTLTARGVHGKELRFSGSLQVVEGAGIAALWIRADGPEGRLAFVSSAREPVRAGNGSQERELLLYVPAEATELKFGVTLSSAGHVDAEHLKLQAEPVPSGAVSAYDVLAHAFPVIQANALNASNVDWSTEQAALLAPDLKGLPAQAAYSKLRNVLLSLADRHSILKTPSEQSVHRRSAVAGRAIEVRLMQDIGYVLVPALSGTDAQATAAFTAELCGQIAKLASAASKGWIVDLRHDTGGNMWPMVNGLYPLLGAGDVGAFRNRAGVVTPWGSRPTAGCHLDLPQSRVAVLIGPRTASSGEAVAVAFRARPEVRFFGQPTAGLATSNQGFPLPDGGSLILTTGIMLDRAGEAYPQGISPEVLVPVYQEAIEAAAGWLRSVSERSAVSSTR